jgi:uncharacterized protein
MKLDQYQRTVLANQYRILEKLDPDGGWGRRLKVVEGGFELQYDFEDSNVLTEEDCGEVGDILNLFRVLRYSYRDLPDAEKKGIEPRELKFSGFDGNDPKEGRYLAYTRFLWDDGQFTESKDDGSDGGNSHSPMLEVYRRMVAAHQGSKVFSEPTREDIVRILEARYPKR